MVDKLQQKRQIFLSYSREDKKTVDRLVEKLEAAGYPVWRDIEAIRGGDPWKQRIVEAIKQAPALVLVLSHNSVESDNVSTELGLAKGKARVIPVAIEQITDLSKLTYDLGGIQRIDLYTDFDAGVGQLLGSLSERGEIPSPDAAPDSKEGGLPTWAFIGAAIGGFLLIIVVVLALAGALPGCTPTGTPPPADELVEVEGLTADVPVAADTPTLALPSPTPTPAPATPTQVPSMAPTSTYTPPPTVPELLHPEEGAARSVNEEIRFEWKGSLADDERYVFIIEHDYCDDPRGCSDVRWIEDSDRSYYVWPSGQWFLTESTFLEWKVVVAKADDPNANRPNKQPVNPIVTSERRAFSLTR
jgi:hypothetical protein